MLGNVYLTTYYCYTAVPGACILLTTETFYFTKRLYDLKKNCLFQQFDLDGTHDVFIKSTVDIFFYYQKRSNADKNGGKSSFSTLLSTVIQERNC